MTERVVVFDIVGTLFSLSAVRHRLEQAGASEEAFDIWFAQALRDYFSRSLADSYVPLKDILESTLPRTLAKADVAATEDTRWAVIEALQELDPAEGAVDACEKLTDAGWKVVAATNSSRAMCEGLLERAHLQRFFSDVVSCDDLGISKPHRRVYEEVERRHPGELWLLAAHAWDVAGAKDAGWRSVWISTLEKVYPAAFPQPDAIATDLREAADTLIDLEPT